MKKDQQGPGKNLEVSNISCNFAIRNRKQTKIEGSKAENPIKSRHKIIFEMLELISNVLCVLISCTSLVLSVFIFCRQNKSEKIKILAEQVIAYSEEEKIAIDKICQLSGSEKNRKEQIELRDATQKQCGIRPNMSATSVKNYIWV